MEGSLVGPVSSLGFMNLYLVLNLVFRDAEWKNLKESVKQELGLIIDSDGEFYMNFNLDFLKYFGKVEIVHQTPSSMMEQQSSSRKYEVIHFQDAWRGDSAGGCGKVGGWSKNIGC